MRSPHGTIPYKILRRIMVNTAIDTIRKVKADRMDATDDEHLEVLVGVEEEEEEVVGFVVSGSPRYEGPWGQ